MSPLMNGEGCSPGLAGYTLAFSCSDSLHFGTSIMTYDYTVDCQPKRHPTYVKLAIQHSTLDKNFNHFPTADWSCNSSETEAVTVAAERLTRNTVQVIITQPQTAVDMTVKILQKSKRRGVQLQKIIIVCIQRHQQGHYVHRTAGKKS